MISSHSPKLRALGRRSPDGFSLIEVLIAMLIFALGMLGTLAMILNGLKITSSSTSRTIASEAVATMAEIVRANPLAVGTTNAGAAKTFDAPTPAIDTDCMEATGCSRNSYIDHTAQAWRNSLAASLPGGTGVVCRDSDPVGHDANIRPTHTPPWDCDGAGAYIVKVCWNESRVGASQTIAGSQGAANGGVICTWANI